MHAIRVSITVIGIACTQSDCQIRDRLGEITSLYIGMLCNKSLLMSI